MTNLLVQCFIILVTVISAVSSSGNPPNFTNLIVNVTTSLPENTPANSTVYTLTAIDAEADNLTYGKISQIPNVPDFQLNTRTGELKSPVGIDADKNITTFQFKFDVSDGTLTVQSATLTVSITDVNDNTPIFTNSIYCKNIHSTETNVIQVTAKDADITSNITYSITGGNTPSTFHIDINNGWITVVNLITNTSNLTVQASDGTFSNSTVVYISVDMPDFCQATTSTATPRSYSMSPGTVPFSPVIEIKNENSVSVDSIVYIESSLTNLNSDAQSSINVVSFNGTGGATTYTLKSLKWVQKYYLAIYVVHKDGTTSNKQYYEAYSGGWLGVLIIVLGWIIINIILVMNGVYPVCMLCAFGSFQGQPVYKTILLNIACIFIVGWIYIVKVACTGKISNKECASCFRMKKIFPFCGNQTSTATVNNVGAGRSTPVSKTDIHLKETTTVSPRPLPSIPPTSVSLDEQPLNQILRPPRAQPFPPTDDHAKTVGLLMPIVDVKTLPPVAVPVSTVDESGETKKRTKKRKKNKKNKDHSSLLKMMNSES